MISSSHPGPVRGPVPGPGVPPRPRQAARVLLVDDHQLIREGLRRAFDRAGDLEVVGEAGTVVAARAALRDLRPDVMVTDIRLPDGDGIALAASARAQRPKLGIVVLTMYAGDEQVLAAARAGASAFVGKDAPADDVIVAARHALANPTEFIARDLDAVWQRTGSDADRPRLSPREREVLGLLVEGLAIPQIARKLFISESTAKTHVAKIYDKLGAANRAQAVMAAVRLQLVESAMEPGGGPALPGRL